MIETNRQDYKKDLEEVIAMFGEQDEITHFQKTDGNHFYDEFILDGQKYNFLENYKTNNLIELKRYEKRFSKLGLYKILVKKHNVKLPWGALTGIRPTKMAYSINGDFEREFEDIFDVSKDKIELVKKIMKNQREIIDRKGEFSDFYVGIPFCPSRCEYCSFMSREIGKSKDFPTYATQLIKEIEGGLQLHNNVRTLYIGGGTPICPDIDSLERILSSLDNLSKKVVEYTVEAGRPDVITKEKLQLLKEHNVSRVCVNPQTFNDRTLQIIGRKHTCSQTFDKYDLVKSFGFDVNMDLIAGLPLETFDDFKNSVDKAISLKPENITIHTLCLKKGAELKTKYSYLEDGEIEKMINYGHKALENNGYAPYYLYRQKYMKGNLENTGYSLKGKECVYNIDVMEETSSNIACGAGAVSKRVKNGGEIIERYGAPKDIATYIGKTDEIIEKKKELFK